MVAKLPSSYQILDLLYRPNDFATDHYGIYMGILPLPTRDETGNVIIKEVESVLHLGRKESDSVVVNIIPLDQFESLGKSECVIEIRSQRSTDDVIYSRIDILINKSDKDELRYKLRGSKQEHEWNCEDFARYILTGTKWSRQEAAAAEAAKNAEEGIRLSMLAGVAVVGVGAALTAAQSVWTYFSNRRSSS
jgi:hypothetical protein